MRVVVFFFASAAVAITTTSDSGGTSVNSTTTADPSCAAWPACINNQNHGNCCPNDRGFRLSCCDAAPPDNVLEEEALSLFGLFKKMLPQELKSESDLVAISIGLFIYISGFLWWKLVMRMAMQKLPEHDLWREVWRFPNWDHRFWIEWQKKDAPRREVAIAGLWGSGCLLQPFIAVIAPFVCLWSGHVSQQRGLPWGAHIVYAVTLVLMTPTLFNAEMDNEAIREWVKGMAVPPLGWWKQTLLAEVATYTQSLSRVADQYLDAVACVIAIHIGYSKAWLMTTIYIMGVLLQPVIIGVVKKDWKEALEMFMNFEPGPKDRKSKAWHCVAMLFTEQIPQICLQMDMAWETASSAAVLVSIAVSLQQILKSAALVADYFEVLNPV